MLVRMHRGRKAYFCKKAKAHYPNETFAYLIGKQVHKGLIEVHLFYYPELDVSTPGAVETIPFDIDSYAKEKDMQVVGDIHSHPDWPPVMSHSDHCDHKKNENKITAILEVPQTGRTRLAIWRDNTPLPCKIEFF
jgi:proteasome lid subunit RPN8/RPN11